MNFAVAYGGLALAQLTHRGCDIPCKSQSLHRLCHVAVDGARMFRLFALTPSKKTPLLAVKLALVIAISPAFLAQLMPLTTSF